MTIMTIMTRVTNKSGRRRPAGDVWSAAEAKARFSELIERARSDGPQTITRNGRTAAVVVAAEDWRRRTGREGSLAEFFAASPLPGSKLEVTRIAGGLRRVAL